MAPGRGSLRGGALGRSDREAMQQPEGRLREPVIQSVMNQRNNGRALQGVGPGVGMIAGGLGILAASQMFAMWVPRRGRSSDHNIGSEAGPLRSEGYEVSTFSVIIARADDLFRPFRVSVPAGLSAQPDPFIPKAVVTPEARSMGTCAGMCTVCAQLLSAHTPRREGDVTAALARGINAQAKVLSHGQA